MLTSVLGFLGVDLQQQANHIQARVEVLRDQTLDKTAQHIKHVSAIIGFALAGAVLALVAVGFGFAALYLWVAAEHGTMTAIGTLAIATAVVAALLFMAAKGIAHRRVASLPAQPIVMPSSPPPVPTTAQAAAAMASLVPPPRAGASLLDIVTHRVTTRAAGASEEAVETAVELVRTGSRSALLGTIAVTALVGLLIGRRRP